MGTTWRVLGLSTALAMGLVPVQAQQGPTGPGQGLAPPGGPHMGWSLELALENQEELGLSGQQVAELEELKTVIDRDVAGLAEEMRVLRESIRSGELERDEGFRRMEALRGEVITASAPLRGRVQEILTVEQHNELQRLVRAERPGPGRGGAMRGGRAGGFRGGNPGAIRGRVGGMGRMGAFRHPGRGAGAGQGFFRPGPARGGGLRGVLPPFGAGGRMQALRGFRRGWGAEPPLGEDQVRLPG